MPQKAAHWSGCFYEVTTNYFRHWSRIAKVHFLIVNVESNLQHPFMRADSFANLFIWRQTRLYIVYTQQLIEEKKADPRTETVNANTS